MMKKVWKFLSYVLVAALASAVTFCVSGGSGGSGADAGYSKLTELADLIDERYVDEYDKTAMEDAAAEAMIGALGDRWSYYISAANYQNYKEQMSNAYVGVGITIQQQEDEQGIRVLQVTVGGPAEEAGVLAGDALIAVDGQSIIGMDADEVKNLVRGEAGTTVELTFLRQEQEITLTVERRSIETAVATYEMLDDSIGLVTIENFDSRCFDETKAAIDTLIEQGAVALIFDVRFNPGGYSSELVKLLDYLLPEGDLFRTVDYLGRENVDQSDAACIEIPMAVLVNDSSYSAAEFFAAALSEYDAAVVVGTPTSGKGYYQQSFKLSDGSAVALSIGKYYTPNGVSLEGVGITPDAGAMVEVDEETYYAIYAGTLDPSEDPQIQRAVALLR